MHQSLLLQIVCLHHHSVCLYQNRVDWTLACGGLKSDWLDERVMVLDFHGHAMSGWYVHALSCCVRCGWCVDVLRCRARSQCGWYVRAVHDSICSRVRWLWHSCVRHVWWTGQE